MKLYNNEEIELEILRNKIKGERIMTQEEQKRLNLLWNKYCKNSGKPTIEL